MATLTVTEFKTVETTTWEAPPGVTSVEYLVVGGGGGGGNGYDNGGGGGGGGGMVLTGTLSVTPGTEYTVTVGAGGAGGADIRSNRNGVSGSNSVFASITSLGGGGGGGSRTGGDPGVAQDGSTTAPTGGNGNGGGTSGDGGGGATGDGTAGGGSPGTGGAGLTSSLSGSSVTYATGGNGASNSFPATNGADGAANTGNGGGGGQSPSFNSARGGNGGSGYVVLSYTIPDVECLLQGTKVLTNHGYKPIESLTDNDLIETSDGRHVDYSLRHIRVLCNESNAPYVIPKHFFAPNRPSSDLYISGRHGMILSSSPDKRKTIRMYPKRLHGIQQDTSRIGTWIDYYHIELPNFIRDDIVCHNLRLEGHCVDFLRRHTTKIQVRTIRNCKRGIVYEYDFVPSHTINHTM